MRIKLVLLAIIISFTITESSSSSSAKSPETGTNIGDIAPELTYASPEGKEISLYSLRGKVVLIDFWAGWCPPCRVENPSLVSAYHKFKNKNFKIGKGFTIYSISLDRSKEQWVGAIEKDKLEWPYHVSDLKYWSAEGAQIYGVRSIPANYLIDSKGVIIAKNLRGEALHMKLSELAK